jgi:transposase
MKIAIGMDLHAKTAVCYAVYAGEGEPRQKHIEFLEEFNRKHRTQASEPEDMAVLAASLRGHDAYILIENSSKTFETYWVLTNLGINVIVAQPQDLYRITKSVKKTDKNDSIELAGYMRRYLLGEREFAVCTMPPKEWMQKREICRTLFREKVHLGNLKRQIRAHLLLNGIRLNREYSDIFCNKAVSELQQMDDVCVKMILNEAVSLKKRTVLEGKYIEHMFDGNRMYELIRSIPGFGIVSAAYLTSMIMDIDRFPNRNSFTAYFGIVPRMRESAETTHNCATTHRGDEEARRLLAQAAFVHTQHAEDSVVTELWKRLKKKGKAHREVQIACARKLLTVVWSVLRNDRPYVMDTELLKTACEEADVLMEESEKA